MQGKNSLFTLDQEGILFDLPAGRKGPTVDGLISQLDIKGDFEITLRFDQLALLGEPAANGTGVAIWLALEGDTQTGVRLGATISRHWRTEGPRFGANKITFQKLGEKTVERYQSTLKAAPATQSAGSLRLTRRGTSMTHWVTQGPSGAFEPVHSWEIGTADVNTLRFQVFPGGLDNGVKVRLLEAEISGDGLFLKGGQPLEFASSPSSDPSQATEDAARFRGKSGLWVWILAGSAALLCLFGGLFWFLRAKRSGKKPCEANPAGFS